MALTEQRLLHFLSRMPFIDSAELAGIVGEAHSTVHRALADLLADGIAGRVNHGTVHLLSSHRYYLTANGVREAAGVLGFDTPSDFVRAYPMSREWLTLLTRRLGRRGLHLPTRRHNVKGGVMLGQEGVDVQRLCQGNGPAIMSVVAVSSQ